MATPLARVLARGARLPARDNVAAPRCQSNSAGGGGPVDGAAGVQARLRGVAWRPVGASMFIAGATLGPLLDGIHGTVQLLHYDTLPVNLGGLHSSLVVPPLLGAFYAVVGALTNLADTLLQESDPATRDCLQRCQSPGQVALSIGIVAALLELSALLYKSGLPYGTLSVVLAAGGAAHWAALDRTRQGLALCALCAVAAPLNELLIINWLGWWQYGAPDVLGAGGFPSWVPWCYFFYTPSVLSLARWLNLRFTTE
eukprot:jgi/Tetstr1/466928/TSEL_011382.t1